MGAVVEESGAVVLAKKHLGPPAIPGSPRGPSRLDASGGARSATRAAAGDYQTTVSVELVAAVPLAPPTRKMNALCTVLPER